MGGLELSQGTCDMLAALVIYGVGSTMLRLVLKATLDALRSHGD